MKMMNILPLQVFKSQCYLHLRKLWTDFANFNGLNKNIKRHQAMREAKPSQLNHTYATHVVT